MDRRRQLRKQLFGITHSGHSSFQTTLTQRDKGCRVVPLENLGSGQPLWCIEKFWVVQHGPEDFPGDLLLPVARTGAVRRRRDGLGRWLVPPQSLAHSIGQGTEGASVRNVEAFCQFVGVLLR